MFSIGDIGKKVIFTPEVVVVRKSKPVDATIVAIAIGGGLRITLADGTEKHVEARLCKKL